MITEAHDGVRLDRVVAELVPSVSRSSIQRHIEAGAVTIEGAPPGRGAKTILRAGDRVRYVEPDPPSARIEAEPEISVRFVYEDEHLVVVDKPMGLVMHPGAGRPRGTLVNALMGRVPLAIAAGATRPGVVHRLDRETSGLVILAKTDEAYAGLRRAFDQRAIEKTYVAICHGVPKPAERRVETLFGRHPRDRKRFTSRVRVGKTAVTYYRVAEIFPGAARLEVSIETGRTHQIRVHLSDLGHPLVGDRVYARKARVTRDPDTRRVVEAFARPALHAFRLAIVHPITHEGLAWEAPLPADLSALLEELREISTASRRGHGHRES
ncbi:MAG: RluA family pseudouridine synthase [Deltaproteobacteria bacterium]|nr:RluA family pseudouridine synthase [Deltaproteobacteria bacterium]